MSVSWNYFDRYQEVSDKYLPIYGEGETRATQTVTAVFKLIYRWYNDGDVYDNTHYMCGGYNDLSTYANWLATYAGAKDILDRIVNVITHSDYEDILKDLADRLFDLDYLANQNELEKIDSVYKCKGSYRFVEYDDYDDDKWYDEWHDEEDDEDEEED